MDVGGDDDGVREPYEEEGGREGEAEEEEEG